MPIHTAPRLRWVAKWRAARRRYRWLLPLFPGAILKLERSESSFDPLALRRRSERFGRPRFRAEVRAALEEFAAGPAPRGAPSG